MYSTIEYADSYIATHYSSKSAARRRWEALSDDEKTVFLTNAFEAIEVLPFRGRKAADGQNTAFPRLPYQYGRTEEGAPQRVKSAEIELALRLSDESKRESSEKRAQLIADGVKSLSVGDLSESYGDSSAVPQTFSASSCKKAMELLSPYLTGGFEM